MAWNSRTSSSRSARMASRTSTATGRPAVLKIAEGPALASVGVKIAGSKPGLDSRANRGPFAIHDRVPCGVAVAALDDHMPVEDALEAEAEAAGGATRGLVEGVALPLQPPVRKLLHGVAHEQKQGLCRGARALQNRRQPDMPDLDAAVLRDDVEIAGHAAGAAARDVADREEQGIVRGGAIAQPGLKGPGVPPRAIGHEAPQLFAAGDAMRSRVKLGGVAHRIDRLQP